MKYPNRLQEVVGKKGVKWIWLAEKAGVLPSVMTRYAQGIRAPYAPTAIKIARALGTTVEELWETEDGENG